MKLVKDSVVYYEENYNLVYKPMKVYRAKDYKFLVNVLDISKISGSILDVGCALGDGIKFLDNKFPQQFNFYGSDISSTAIDKCKKRFGERFEFFRHDFGLCYSGRRFDGVICLQTLEHVTDPILFCENLLKIADKFVVVSVPYKNRRKDKNHLWMFDEDDFPSCDQFYIYGGKTIFYLWGECLLFEEEIK